MKKIFTHIRTLAAVLFAGAAICACTLNEELINEQDKPVVDGPKVYRLTINAGSAETKALTFFEEELRTRWVAGDVLDVYKGSTKIGQLDMVGTPTNDGKNATFSGVLTPSVAETINNGDKLDLRYHYRGFSAFSQQNGTLNGIPEKETWCASDLDGALATVKVKSVDNEVITLESGKVQFTTQTAVLKLKLTTDGTTGLNANTLKLDVQGTMQVFMQNLSFNQELFSFVNIVSPDTYTTNGEHGLLYLALPDKDDLAEKLVDKINEKLKNDYPQFAEYVNISLASVKNMLATSTIILTATDDSATYTGSVTGYPFEKRNYYATNVTLTSNSSN